MGRHYFPSPDTVGYEAEAQTATITYSRLRPGRYTLLVFHDDVFPATLFGRLGVDAVGWFYHVFRPGLVAGLTIVTLGSHS